MPVTLVAMEESAMILPTDLSVIVQSDLVDFDVKQVGDMARVVSLSDAMVLLLRF